MQGIIYIAIAQILKSSFTSTTIHAVLNLILMIIIIMTINFIYIASISLLITVLDL